jgi:hypothetical protein
MKDKDKKIVLSLGTTKAGEEPKQPKPTGVGLKSALDLFNNAPTVEKVEKKKTSKKEREEVEINDLDKLASFKVLEKVLEEESSGLQARIREEVVNFFAERMSETGQKPDSFVGIGEYATASCEIRRRGSNMPLDPETVERLIGAGLESCINRNVKVPERLILNPNLSQDSLVRLAELVKNDSVLKNEVVVMRQEEEFNFSVSESGLDLIAKSRNAELILSVLEKMATFAIGKFKIDGESIEQGKDDDKCVTPNAKKRAIEALISFGVLPQPEVVAVKKRTKKKDSGEGEGLQ